MRELHSPTLRRTAQAVFIALAALVALAVPAGQMLGLNAWNPAENRARAPVPTLPRSLEQFEAWPARMETALADRFGFRGTLIGLRNQVLYQGFGSFAAPEIFLGADGRLLFSWLNDGMLDDGRPYTALLRRTCGYRLPPQALPELAQNAAAMLAAFGTMVPRADLLVVPSSGLLYPASHPAWLRERCARGEAPTLVLARSLPAEWAGHLAFPLAEMADPALPRPAIAPERFHWDGTGASLVEAWWAEGQRGLPRLRDLPALVRREPSDLGTYFQGVEISGEVLVPDLTGPGITSCDGPACYPEMAGIAAKMVDVTRHRADGAGGRLLILSDSFGNVAAPWFLRHFAEVRHFAMNYHGALSPAQREEFRRQVLDLYQPDQVLVLVHDANIFRYASLLREGLR